MLSFADLLAPTTPDSFFANYWEQQPLILQRAKPEYYEGLLSMADLDHIVSSSGLKHPDFRLVKEGATLPLQRYTRENGRNEAVADVDKILGEYGRGASIVVESLHERWSPLAYFCRDLEQHLSYRVQTNIYLTPRSSQGFAPHYDTHDVFVLQIHGSKHWLIYDSPVRLPDRSLPHHTERDKLGAPLYELDVTAGDLVYLPRGFVHEALTSEEESLHITVGIITYSWFDVFQEVLSTCRRQDSRFREALPPGFATTDGDATALCERFRALAAALMNEADVDGAVDKLATRFVSSRRPLLDGALSRFYQVENITPDSVVQRRNGIIFRITPEPEVVKLSFHGKHLQFPDYVEPSLRQLAQATRMTVRDIDGELDDAGKLVLVRSLVREGFLILDSD